MPPSTPSSSRDTRFGHRPIRNHIGWRDRLSRMRGSSIQRDLRHFDRTLDEINALEPGLEARADDELRDHAARLREQASADATSDVRARTFALVREVARRRLGLRPFDEQIVAGLALDRGAVVEMQTGEGKTLAAVMPVALNAFMGGGVHVLTFNDYLARRDADWMGPIYSALGLTVACVQNGMTPADRRRAYRADVTYVTAKEAGFDYLRDMLATDISGVVHRRFGYAVVDEADSLLIDEARVPLVIAGSIARDGASPARLTGLVSALTPGVHYDLDEYGRDVELTERGIDLVEQTLACGRLHDEHNLSILTDLNCALHAHVLLRRDVDYLVRDGRIGIIDELTGRVVADRHWPDGLQAAVEAKEGLARLPDGRILGSITLQHFLQRYPRLCGMTGTAQPAAAELEEFYGLPVVVIPTHLPLIRIDRPDLVFTHRDAKERAVVEEIRRVHADRRPVLVGTLTVEESERLADRLRAADVPCRVLNARNDAAEAEIVAAAGAAGAVTISTNMAGRGTDIRLGGSDGSERERVVSLGGLYVIGTNRHESRRVDLQLRGRAGRQGDPGESRFFVSLEDELLVRYGIHNLLAGRFAPQPQLEPIAHPVVLAEVARAQRIVEGQNFEVRRTLWRYASVVEQQRQEFMAWRQAILDGTEEADIWSRSPEPYQALVAAAGSECVARAERLVMLRSMDRAWCDHLALIADLREGGHLVALGGRDPLSHFTTTITTAFRTLDERIEESVAGALASVRVGPEGIDLAAVDVKGPSATWTYLVNDDQFRNQIGMLLTGPGRATFAVGAAISSMPLLILWGLVDTFARRRPTRR